MNMENPMILHSASSLSFPVNLSQLRWRSAYSSREVQSRLNAPSHFGYSPSDSPPIHQSKVELRQLPIFSITDFASYIRYTSSLVISFNHYFFTMFDGKAFPIIKLPLELTALMLEEIIDAEPAFKIPAVVAALRAEPILYHEILKVLYRKRTVRVNFDIWMNGSPLSRLRITSLRLIRRLA
jgi:hypothetical protein